MSTSSVSYTVPSNGWTGSINVTDCNLETDLTVNDFKIFYDGVEQGAGELANWDKVSSISLSYSGSSLNINDVVLIRRSTPFSVISTVSPLETISSSLWNAEFDRIVRRDEELYLYGSTLDSNVGVSDEPYSESGWNGVTTQAPTKNAVRDKIETLTGGATGALVDNTAYNATSWNGVTTQAPSKDAVRDKIETLTGGETAALVSDTAYATSWNGVTTIAPSKNAVFDSIEEHRRFEQMSGRLTLTSNTPVLTSAVSGSTIYFTPFNGNTVYLYDTGGTRWVRHTLTEISLALGTLTDDIPYDIYLYNNAGTLTLEKLAWTDRDTRATALAFQNGVYVKNGDASRRYLGTVASPASNTVYQGTSTISTNASFHNTVWNLYNKVRYLTFITFIQNPPSTGSPVLIGTNLFGRFVMGINGLSFLQFNLNIGLLNTTGVTTVCVASILEDFGGVTFSVNGGTYANNEYAQLTGSATFVGTEVIGASGLISLSPRLNVGSLAGTGWVSLSPVQASTIVYEC